MDEKAIKKILKEMSIEAPCVVKTDLRGSKNNIMKSMLRTTEGDIECGECGEDFFLPREMVFAGVPVLCMKCCVDKAKNDEVTLL